MNPGVAMWTLCFAWHERLNFSKGREEGSGRQLREGGVSN